MSLFGKKTPPKECPKCGEVNGWRCLRNETSETPEMDRLGQQAMTYGHAARGTFGQTTNRRIYSNKQKLKFHCDKCGFEKSY